MYQVRIFKYFFTVDLVKIKPSSSTNLKNSPITQKNKKKKVKTTNATSRPTKKVKSQNAIHKKSLKNSISKKNKSNNVGQQKEKISDQIKIDKEIGKLLDNLEKNFASVNQTQDNSKLKKENSVT